MASQADHSVYIESAIESHQDVIIAQLAELIPNLQQDPQPFFRLVERLVNPSSFTFGRVLAIKPTIDFVAGLSAPLSSVNLITLRLLKKAAFSQSDRNFVAGKPDIVAALIRLWLCAGDTAVSQEAQNVILALLAQDEKARNITQRQTSENLMWRRLFRDRDIYGSIFSICSLKAIGEQGRLNKKEKTIAQARLLEFLLKISSYEYCWYTQLPEIEAKYGIKDGGLIEFAAVHMVDFNNDVLMHVTLVEFFAELLNMTPLESRRSSKALEFFIRHNLHDRTISYYLEPEKHDFLDLTYLYSCSASYLSAYSSRVRAHFLSHPSTVDSTLKRLSNVLLIWSATKMASGQAPKHDLRVLTSLPRIVLLPTHEGPQIFLQLRPSSGNADFFRTLAIIFRGPEDNFEASEKEVYEEKATARALYYLYLEQFPDLWKQTVQAANTVALKEAALAALELISSVLTASWALLPSEESKDPYRLPTEEELSTRFRIAHPLPLYGIEAIIASKSALDSIIPYLLGPTHNSGNVMARADMENAVYEVARAKYEVLILFRNKLGEIAANARPDRTRAGDFALNVDNFLAAISRRIADGPLGGNTAIGSTVATLEL